MNENTGNGMYPEDVPHISPLYFAYLLYSGRHEDLNITTIFKDENPSSEEEAQIAKQISELKEAADFFRLMRKPMVGYLRYLLREQLLVHEDEVTDMIKKRIMRSAVDEFIENAFDFFIRCRNNHSDWIAENIDDIVNPYARSMMCLALGFIGRKEHIPLLEKQGVYLVNNQDEDFDLADGPDIACYMLEGREDEIDRIFGF